MSSETMRQDWDYSLDIETRRETLPLVLKWLKSKDLNLDIEARCDYYTYIQIRPPGYQHFEISIDVNPDFDVALIHGHRYVEVVKITDPMCFKKLSSALRKVLNEIQAVSPLRSQAKKSKKKKS